jgi:hypothetical protein
MLAQTDMRDFSGVGMNRKAILSAAMAVAFSLSATPALAAPQLTIFGSLGCAVYDLDGEFMRLNSAGMYETVKAGRSAFFQTNIEISKSGYKLLGPQFKVIDQYGNESLFPKVGKFSTSFSYVNDGRDIFDITLGSLDGSWDNTWERLELVINPTLGIKLGCNFPSD